MKQYTSATILTLALLLLSGVAHAKSAQELIQEGMDYLRGKSSISVVEMTIKRPDWERKMTIKAWTKGMEDSIFRIIAPPRDKDNGTLKKGREMWTYNPKVNRVIKIPPSMMSQSWMGSDFSNDDLSKTDSIIKDYTHKLLGEETQGGVKVYEIESIPLPDAPVVWGKQTVKIREDFIIVEQKFFDEDMELVKTLTMLELQQLGGRTYPKIWRMEKLDAPGEYTQLEYKELEFDASIPNSAFTRSALKTKTR